MPKDFAVQGYKKETTSNKSGILILIAIISIISTLYVVKTRKNVVVNVDSEIEQVASEDTTTQDLTRPRFEFYTMLPDNQEHKHVNVKFGKYILQLAEFRYHAEAKKLLNKLKSKQYLAVINTVVKDSKTTYKVEIGPFNSNASAEKVQLRLKEDRYRSSIKEITETDIRTKTKN